MVNDVQGIEVFLALGDAVWAGGLEDRTGKTQNGKEAKQKS